MKQASKIILINPEKQILLYLRDNKPSIPYPGWWDLFGGGIEENETPEQAIIREIKEEIDIEVKEIKYLSKVIVPKHDLNPETSCNFVFKGLINCSKNKIDLKEGQKLNYFKLQDLHNLKFPHPWLDFILKNKTILGF